MKDGGVCARVVLLGGYCERRKRRMGTIDGREKRRERDSCGAGLG